MAGPDLLGDRDELMGHRVGVAPGQNQPRRFALLRADRAEDVGRRGALVMRCGRSRAAPSPAPCDLVLLPDPGFVAEPNFYSRALDSLLTRDRVQTGGKCFLKCSIAPSA